MSECRECREGAPLLLRVSVSVCCKKVGGRIHQRYKDRCYSGSRSSRHTGIDIETEEVISVNEPWSLETLESSDSGFVKSLDRDSTHAML